MKQVENSRSSIEIWGGVECSIVRIDDTVHDQLKMSGHEERINDLELFAELGIKKLRYPILWEKYEEMKEVFFNLHDTRLQKLKSLNITPIAGLLHHGSGPFHTDLLKPDFPFKLADYAYNIAERYPWIEYYTPINEPLTTARFSGLYGIWYPHKKDDYHFIKIFLNEIKGIILSMQRIREINPNARLVQTEDIARVYSTKVLEYQAKLENERTWLTYDLLTGKFNEEHTFWNYFIDIGISEKELQFFTRNKCIPDICGFNYYVTSERFLDHRTDHYPELSIGGNDIHDYADIEVVRVSEANLAGIQALLEDAFNRYHLPVALTEIHLACTREEQLRWFNEAYQATIKLFNKGHEIKAITAWSLLGSFDWNSLLQLKGEYYESGIFDIRSGKPRPTALTELLKSYNTNYEATDLIDIAGWWNRNIRIKYQAPDNLRSLIEEEYHSFNDVKPIIILGDGPLSFSFQQICKLRGLPAIKVSTDLRKLFNENEMFSLIEKIKPWAVVNTIGLSKIDEAEQFPIHCYKENTLFPKILASICARKEIRMLTFSTDQVFNGKKSDPYLEADPTDPLNVFGMSKKIAEESILSLNPEALIIRSGLLMNPMDSEDFLSEVLFGSEQKQNHYFVSDVIVSPSYLPDMINTALDLLIDKEKGIWHLSGPEAVSYYDFAKLAIGIAGLTNKKIHSIPSIMLPMKARRPSYSALRSESGIILPKLEVSIYNFIVNNQPVYKL
ncbi:MAG TPA: family 1 glycosylhydrolase [Lentimicrobium sp.]|nr:family 1 glycosylhydrolase [Lentimicrobium sp.]